MTNDWKAKIQLIGWDIDGTLYPPSSEMELAINNLKIKAVAEKLKCSETEARNRFNTRLAQLKSNTKVLDSLGIDGQAFFVGVWDQLDLQQYIHPDPNLVAAFSRVKSLRQAVLTNSNTPEQAEKKLSLLGLSPDQFSPILTSTMIGINKPDKKAFEIFLHSVNLEPEQVLYVGDREEVDVLPAHALGMRTAIIRGKSNVADLTVLRAQELLLQFVPYA